MGKRKVSILEQAAEAVADVALFIEGKGMPQTARKFVDGAFNFFEQLSDERIIHKPCNYSNVWQALNYRGVTYKKYVVAYLSPASRNNNLRFCSC